MTRDEAIGAYCRQTGRVLAAPKDRREDAARRALCRPFLRVKRAAAQTRSRFHGIPSAKLPARLAFCSRFTAGRTPAPP